MSKEPQAKLGPLNSPREEEEEAAAEELGQWVVASASEKETELKRGKMTVVGRLFVLGLALIAAAAVNAQDEESALPLEPAPSSGALSAEFHS